MSKAKIVVLGGGNGTSRLLLALKPLLDSKEVASLHAVVLNADDGGSTGRLRSQYGVGAMGDFTKCLMALSGFVGDVRGEQLLRALDYRFATGDFAGHTLRNIFLASLEKTSDLDAAIAMMARVLQVPKAAGVVPATLKPLTQQVIVAEGRKTRLLGEGQHFISHKVDLQAERAWQPGDVRVQFAEGDVPLNPRAAAVLKAATHIIVAPGHTFGTILPTLALPALGRALKKTKARFIVVMTLLTTPRHTTGWAGEDFVRVYESYIFKTVDVVVANTGVAPVDLVAGQEWVRFSATPHDYHVVAEDIVSYEKQEQQKQDVVPRAVIVHSPEKIRRLLRGILER